MVFMMESMFRYLDGNKNTLLSDSFHSAQSFTYKQVWTQVSKLSWIYANPDISKSKIYLNVGENEGIYNIHIYIYIYMFLFFYKTLKREKLIANNE